MDEEEMLYESIKIVSPMIEEFGSEYALIICMSCIALLNEILVGIHGHNFHSVILNKNEAYKLCLPVSNKIYEISKKHAEYLKKKIDYDHCSECKNELMACVCMDDLI